MYYLRNLLLSIVVLFLCAGAFNALVDPYGFYWGPTVDGLNAKKTQADERVREVTPYRALALQPDTVLIGSSRVQLGFDADSEVFAGRTVFNLALPGSGINENLKYALQQVQLNPRLQTLIIGMDYRYFLHNYHTDSGPWSKPQMLAKIDKLPETPIEKFQRIYPALFSLNTLFDSLMTLFKQHGAHNHITPAGSNTGHYYLATIQAEGKKRFFAHQTQGLVQRFSRKQLRYQGEAGTYGIELYRAFLDEVSNANPQITVYSFINPYHQSYWRLIKQTGHWDYYLQWKQDLAVLADNYPQHPFFDFSLPSPETLENPNYNEDRTPMAWFWEPAHYRTAFGNLIIDTMLNDSSESRNWPIKLNSQSIDDALKQSEAGLTSPLIASAP